MINGVSGLAADLRATDHLLDTYMALASEYDRAWSADEVDAVRRVCAAAAGRPRLDAKHGVALVDKVGITCLCGDDFAFASGGWLTFNAHLAGMIPGPADTVTVWQGECGHLWRFTGENTGCPVCREITSAKVLAANIIEAARSMTEPGHMNDQQPIPLCIHGRTGPHSTLGMVPAGDGHCSGPGSWWPDGAVEHVHHGEWCMACVDHGEKAGMKAVIVRSDDAVRGALRELHETAKAHKCGEPKPDHWGIPDCGPDCFVERALGSDARPAHQPGDYHHYQTACTVCGQKGSLFVAMQPDRYSPPCEFQRQPDGTVTWSTHCSVHGAKYPCQQPLREDGYYETCASCVALGRPCGSDHK